METRTWHRCDNCGHACPHDSEYCRCPWCRTAHGLPESFEEKLARDTWRRVHPTLMTEFDCKMAVIAGLLRLISGRAGITYTGERTEIVGWGPPQPVLGVTYNDPVIGPTGYHLWGTQAWDELKKAIPPLQALGSIHYGEDLAA